MEYLFLFCAVAILWLTSLKATKWELMSPVSLALLGLTVSLGLSIIGLLSWNHVTLGWEAASVILIGVASLLVGLIAARRISDKHIVVTQEKMAARNTKCDIWKYVAVGAVLIIAIAVRVVETYRIGADLGIDASSYSAVAKAVRNELATFMDSESMRVGVGFSLVCRQLEKVAVVTGYVASYLLARSLAKRNDGSAVVSATLPLLLSCAYCLASGSRATIMYYGISFAVSLFICLARANGSSHKLSLRFLSIGAIVCCVAAAVFYASGSLVGRSASSGLVEYISFYFGCGTPALQNIIDSGSLPEMTPGVRTFYYLFSLPYKLGIISDYPSYSLAWVDMGGHACNIFTGFARYYLDFGILGVAVLSALAGGFMTIAYELARKKGLPVFVVFASYLGTYAFDFAREEFVFSRLFSPTQFVSVAIMVVITLFLTTSIREDVRRAKNFVFGKRAA